MGTGTPNTRVAWEIVEYIGDAADDNEIIVRDQGRSTFVGTNLTLDTSTVSSVADDNDVVVWVTGVANPDTLTTDYNTGQVTSEWVGGATDVGRFTREEAGSDAVQVSWAIVEFVGSNWNIQRVENDYTGTAEETEAITAVGSVDRAFVYGQHRGNQPGLDDHGSEVWLSATNTVSFQIQVNSGNQFAVAWVIENTQTDGTPMAVERGTFSKAANAGSEPDTVDVSYGPIDDLTVASVFATNRSSGTGTAFPRGNFAARLTSTSNIELWYSDNGQTQNGRWAVVEWPTVVSAVGFTEQYHYRWRDDSTDLNTTGGWLAAEDTAVTGATKDETYRVRVEVANTGAGTEVSAKTYELQWGDATDLSGCSAISTWTGVANSSDEWDMVDSTHIPEGQSTTSGLLANTESLTFTNGEGRDTADTTGSIGPMLSNNYTELEYSITPTSTATNGHTYCFRVYDTTAGAVLDEYDVFPEITLDSVDTQIVSGLGESGTFTSTTDGSFTTINYDATYVNPVVVGTANSYNSGEEGLVFEVENVGTTSADMRICKSQGSSSTGCDTMTAVTVGYMVIDIDKVDDFDGIEAGTFVESGQIETDSTSPTYSESFSTTPYVFANVQTVDGTDPIEIKVISTSTTGFTAGLCQQNSVDDCDGTHGNETVGWVAIEPDNAPFGNTHELGSVSVSNSSWTSQSFTESFSSAPVAVVEQQTNSGAQNPEIDEADNITTTGMDVRFCELDTVDDCDTHNPETVTWFAIESGEFTTRLNLDLDTFRFYEDNDAVQPATPLFDENTNATDVADNDVLRLRLGLEGGIEDIAADTFDLTLQYGQGSDCSAIATWTDVGASGSGEVWRFHNATPADETEITANLLSNGNVFATFEKANDTALNPNAINDGQRAEWDFVFENNGATQGVNFCFRVVTSAGDPVHYTRYPQAVTENNPAGMYNEKREVFSATSASTWETINLTNSPYSIPTNTVVEIGVANDDVNGGITAGVRSTSNSQDRFIELKESEGGGNNYVVMHVETDSDGEIEMYTTNTADTEFYLMGYWASGSFVDSWDNFNPGADTTWTNVDLSGSPFDVPVNRVIEIVAANGEFNTENQAGIQRVGGPDTRLVDIAEAELPTSSFTTWTAFVQGDENSQIEVYAEDDSEMEFYMAGYWDVQPGHFTELSTTTTDPTLDATWQTRDLSGAPFNIPGDGVAEVLFLNGDVNAQAFFGTRVNGSSVNRFFDIMEAEAGGRVPMRVHSLTDANSIIQIYHQDVSDVPFEFAISGFWEPNVAPDAPTSLSQTEVDDTVIATGDWINFTTIEFKATISDTELYEALQLCVEVKPLGTAFDGTDTACSGDYAYNGTDVNAQVTASIPGDDEFHWQVRTRDVAADYSTGTSYGGNPETERDFGVDVTAPSGGTVFDGSTIGVDVEFSGTSLDTLSGNWSGIDSSISGLSLYEYSIGTTPGDTDVLTWQNNGTGTTFTESSLTLNTSQPYYANVRTTDNAGNSSVISSDGQFVTPSITFSVSPASLDLGNINAGNSYTTTNTTTLTTSTNAYNGYVIRGVSSALLTNQYSDTIGYFDGGTYAAPDEWLGGDTGYGYTSSDTLVQGSNLFNSTPCAGGGNPPCYAPWSSTAPGDIVADHTSLISGAPVINEQFTITHRVTSLSTQEPGIYRSVIIFTATPTY